MNFTTTLLALAIALLSLPLSAQPPYSGTIFIDGDIITSDDPTDYTGFTSDGMEMRNVFDRRTGAFGNVLCHLYTLTYADGTTIEAQVNTEFTAQQAQDTAVYFGLEVGRLPRVLRRDVDALWIHKGNNPFGGGNRSILIHTDQAAAYVTSGILEETLVHEAAHTSLQADHATAPDWVAAQNADPDFISTYAEEFPTVEDISESFLTWLAVRYRSATISSADYDKITLANPNRNAYFDAQNFELAPLQAALPVTLTSFNAVAGEKQVKLNWSTEVETDNRGFGIERSTDGNFWTSLAFVPASADSGSGRDYDYQDTSPTAGSNYYRLRQEDYDGTNTYSGVRRVDFQNSPPVVFPNPASDFTVLRWSAPIESIRSFTLMNQQGAALPTRFNVTDGGIRISVAGLPTGMYLLAGRVNGVEVRERVMVRR